jgi:hypothetical protein
MQPRCTYTQVKYQSFPTKPDSIPYPYPYLLFLGNGLAELEGGAAGGTDDNTVLNIVEFLTESWASDLDLAGGDGWVGNWAEYE